jgi:alpha-galactosidase
MPIRLDDQTQTLVLAETGGLPAIIYFGPRLPEAEDLGQLALAVAMDLTGGMLDQLAPLTICPVGDGWFQGQPALSIASDTGAPLVPAFAATRVARAGQALLVEARDVAQGLTYRARLALDGVLELSASLEAATPIRVNWFAAPVLPVPGSHAELIEFSGKWNGELHTHRQLFAPGARLREGRNGRSGQEVPPFAIACTPGTRYTAGEALAFAYGWPGGHRSIAEELPCGRRQLQYGHAAGSEREAGTLFETATLTVARSDSGLNGTATQMQAYVRDRLVPWPDHDRPRPVHYNCWEAVYFKHDLSVLAEMAERAARIGAERFVLDDGWFGKRDDDTTSLGDWVVDRRKWPDGLKPLIDKVHSVGMSFGLWVEPEMVNKQSDLYRAHPEWILGGPDQVTGRGQLVLDISKSEVREYLFEKLDAILTESDIDYLKWDHNRHLPVLDAAQGRGILDLLARLRAAHPKVEIESCASGGGRIDYGILQHTHRVWLSDCIDAIERLRIQQTASLFIPSAITGSHVGAYKSHTTGRALPTSFRAWIAASRHMGFESDLRVISAEDEAILTRATAWYRANREWMMAGAIHQLDSDDATVTAELQLSASGDRFVVFAGQGAFAEQILPRPLRLTALDPDARYRITLVNAEDRAPQSRGPAALKTQSLILSGHALMRTGLALPVAWPATLFVVEGCRLET